MAGPVAHTLPASPPSKKGPAPASPDQQRHALLLLPVSHLPLHAVAVGHLRDAALQHGCVAGAHLRPAGEPVRATPRSRAQAAGAACAAQEQAQEGGAMQCPAALRPPRTSRPL